MVLTILYHQMYLLWWDFRLVVIVVEVATPNTLLVGAFLINVTCELTLLYSSTILLLYQDSFYNNHLNKTIELP